jgi:hypothetical protein
LANVTIGSGSPFLSVQSHGSPSNLNHQAQWPLGNLNLSNGTNGLRNLFLNTPEEFSEKKYKKYEVYEIDEDLLALSTAWLRLRTERNLARSTGKAFTTLMPEKMLDGVLFNHVTQDDKDRASLIRSYYSKKITQWGLSNSLSKFRQDMKSLVLSEGKLFKEDIIPLSYRLPEFYDYDVEMDKRFMAHNVKVDQPAKHHVVERELTFVGTSMRNKKYHETKEYWFSDQNDNLNLISVQKSNPLLAFMDHVAKSPFKVSAVSSVRSRDNREYCALDKFRFS